MRTTTGEPAACPPVREAPAVAELDKEFDPADVTLYLSLAAEQWPSVPEVDAAWQMRA